jgi:hypothetical protein
MISVFSTVALEPGYEAYASGFGVTLGVLLFVLFVVLAIGFVRRMLNG